MAKAKQVIQGSIKGAFDTVNVGDTVMVVTTGYSHNCRVNKGKYIGYIEGKQYGNTIKKAVIEVESQKNVMIKPDGTVFDWSKDYNQATWETVRKTLTNKSVPFTRRTTLKLNRIATLK